MASGTQQKNGTQIVWFSFGGKRRTMRLGKGVTTAQRVTFQANIQRMVDLVGAGFPIDVDLLAWVETLSDRHADYLARIGLVARRSRFTFASLVDAHLKRHKNQGSAQSTIDHLKVAGANLVEFFGADTPIEITRQQVDLFERWLRTHGKKPRSGDERGPLAPGTVALRLRRAKEFYQTAKLNGWKPGPNCCTFDHCKSKHVKDTSRDTYIPFTDWERVLSYVDRADVRLALALVRIVGISPSTVPTVKWTDWDFDRSILTVERHKTGVVCRIPIYDELLDYYWAAYELAEPGEVYCHLFARGVSQTTWKERLTRAARLAEVPLWPKPFINARASAAWDLLSCRPLQEATSVLGHSPSVMLQHYRRDEHVRQSARSSALHFPDYSQKRSAKRSAPIVSDSPNLAYLKANIAKNAGPSLWASLGVPAGLGTMLPEGAEGAAIEPTKQEAKRTTAKKAERKAKRAADSSNQAKKSQL